MEKKPGELQKGLRTTFRYLALYKKDLLVVSVLSIVSAITAGTVPYIAGKLIDSLITPRDIVLPLLGSISFIFFILALWIIIQTIQHFTDLILDRKGDQISAYIESEFIARSYGHLLKVPLSFHHANKMGETTSKIQRAAGALTNVTQNVFIGLTPQVLSIFIALVLVYNINWILATVLMAGTLLYVIVAFKKVLPIGDLQGEMHKAYNDAYGHAYDVVQNVREIKQSTTEEYERKLIRYNLIEKATPQWLKITRLWQSLNLYQRLIIVVTQGVIYIFSIHFILQGSMTVGVLIAFNGYAALFIGPFVVLSRNWQQLQSGLTGVAQVETLLETPEEPYSRPGAVVLDSVSGTVEFKNVSFGYDETPVLKNISFATKPGEIIALVGESGVGKSTLIDLLSAYNFPTKGEIFVDGHEIQTLNLLSLRKNISVVSQEIVLFNDSIKKNVSYGSPDASEKKLLEAARKSHSLEFIEKFPDKWEQVVGERGVKLSVGQKQRVAIARAILRDPKILILDEPTSALDAKTESAITKSLDELMRGRTTFIIAHRLSTVRRADQILVIKDGKIVEHGKHDELIAIEGGEYRHLYELQIGLHV